MVNICVSLPQVFENKFLSEKNLEYVGLSIYFCVITYSFQNIFLFKKILI